MRCTVSTRAENASMKFKRRFQKYKSSDSDYKGCEGNNSEPCGTGRSQNDYAIRYEIQTTCSKDNVYERKTISRVEDAAACASNPCNNGGSCVEMIDNYTCLCPDPWTGAQCNNGEIFRVQLKATNQVVDIDDCASDPCVNGGTCNDAVNSYTCSFPTDYYGNHCECKWPS